MVVLLLAAGCGMTPRSAASPGAPLARPTVAETSNATLPTTPTHTPTAAWGVISANAGMTSPAFPQTTAGPSEEATAPTG